MTGKGTLAVSGGAASIAADFENLRQLAAALDDLARPVRSTLGATVAALAEPSVLAAGALDPVGAWQTAQAAAELIATCAVTLATAELLAQGLRAAALAYCAADDASRRLAPAIAAAVQLPSAALAAAPLFGRAVLTADPGALVDGALAIARRDPQVAGVLLQTLATAPLPPTLARSALSAAMAALSTIYRDGRPVVTPRPQDPTTDAEGPPRSLAGLLTGLDCRNEHTAGGGIDVRFVGNAGRSRRAVIVDITGTKDWAVTDRDHPNVADLGTNLAAIGNRSTSYEQGVRQALRASGVAPDEPIMLIGHSQGGVIAARLAADLHGSGEFHVSHLVTAGSPIGQVEVPADVQVLALENKGDVVPQLDGADNVRRANWTTVTIDRAASGGNAPGPRHSLSTAYLPGARDIDESTDSSLAAWREGASEFLTGDSVRSDVYRVTRQP